MPIEIPQVLPTPVIEPELLREIQADSYVYVHCFYDNPTMDDALIRIWRSTFLIDTQSAERSKLVHIENISFAPIWTLIPGAQPYRFLLIFEALPKGCLVFDLLEDIPQAGGFCIRSIIRNASDVYHVTLD